MRAYRSPKGTYEGLMVTYIDLRALDTTYGDLKIPMLTLEYLRVTYGI